MALNPPLLPGAALPLPVAGETFVLHRRGIQLDAEVLGMRKYQHKGDLFLSTLRMVFVRDARASTGWFGLGGEAPSDLVAYDLPLSLVRSERFNQPIFGCNNVEGVCLPLPGTPADTHFRLSFYEGGVGTFLPLFFDLLNRNRHGPVHAPAGLDTGFASALASGRFMQVARTPPPPSASVRARLLCLWAWSIVFPDPLTAHQHPHSPLAQAAYIDPNDPTTLYLPSAQPAQAQANSLTREEYYRHGSRPIRASALCPKRSTRHTHLPTRTGTHTHTCMRARTQTSTHRAPPLPRTRLPHTRLHARRAERSTALSRLIFYIRRAPTTHHYPNRHRTGRPVVHVCMYVCMYACIYPCMYACDVCMYVCMHVSASVSVFLCVYDARMHA